MTNAKKDHAIGNVLINCYQSCFVSWKTLSLYQSSHCQWLRIISVWWNYRLPMNSQVKVKKKSKINFSELTPQRKRLFIRLSWNDFFLFDLKFYCTDYPHPLFVWSSCLICDWKGRGFKFQKNRSEYQVVSYVNFLCTSTC